MCVSCNVLKYPLLSVTIAADPVMCTGEEDTCGGDETMCCGVALNGTVQKADGSASGVAVPNIAVCNLKPGSDGKPLAVDLMGTLTGADEGKTEIKYMFPKAGFSCFVTPAPPGPSP